MSRSLRKRVRHSSNEGAMELLQLSSHPLPTKQHGSLVEAVKIKMTREENQPPLIINRRPSIAVLFNSHFS